MAEFIEVARAKRRMCNAHKKKCSECKLQENCSLLNVCAYNDNEVKKLENEVMSWAADHPEPVYPSWISWLMSQGVIPDNYTAENSTDSGVRAGTFFVTSKAFQPIPANIAQKLGIEPKEG